MFLRQPVMVSPASFRTCLMAGRSTYGRPDRRLKVVRANAGF